MILFVLSAIIDWDTLMECDFVENAQRHGRLVRLSAFVARTRPVGNLDNVINEL